jgi:hypothetical protein
MRPNARVPRRDPAEDGVRPRQRLEREDPRLRIQPGTEQGELAAVGADVDHAREVAPGQRRLVLDGRGHAMAQARAKAAVEQQARELPAAADQLGSHGAIGHDHPTSIVEVHG